MPDAADSLQAFFRNERHRLIMKWSNYFPIYEELAAPFRHKRPLKMLEIGVAKGGSLQLWRNYFGPDAIIVGADIEPDCRKFAIDNTFVRIGDQGDRAFLRSLVDEFGVFDIILDDGGHKMDQQIVAFEELYPALAADGLYIVEDVHTSYWPEFGGGLKRQGTFIEFMKAKIDEINGFHSLIADGALLTDLTRSTYSITFYDSVVALKKRVMNIPVLEQIGSET